MNQSNKWWANPGFSLDKVNICGILDGSIFKNMTEGCDQCNAKFNFLRRKKQCPSCGLMFCGSCLNQTDGQPRKCKKCHILSIWPIERSLIASLRVRDLRHYLHAYRIATNCCREKQDLVDLVIAQVKLKHFSSQNRTGNPPDFRVSAPSSSNTPSNGIRVSGVNLPESGLGDDEGIRVFAMSPEDPLPSDHQQSNDSSSSSWSMLQQNSDDEHTSPNAEASEVTRGQLVSQDCSSGATEQIDDVLDIENEIETDQGTDGHEIGVDEQATRESESVITPPLPAEPPVLPEKAAVSSSVANIVKLSSLVDEDSIKSLSVRQCKDMLLLHRVDFSGVWEKHELLQKVVILWKDYKERYADISSLPEDQICKICMDAPMDCVFLQCGHMAACTFCGKQCAECPICRQNVVRIVRIFKA